MSNNEIVPVKHNGASAFGATAAGTAGGALKGGLSAMALWIGGFILVGALLGVTIATSGLGTFALGSAAGGTGILGAISTVLGSPITWGIAIGGGVGAVLGTGTSWLPGGLGAIFGGVGGHHKASARVNNEHAAAMQVETQIASARAMSASVPTQVNVGYPAQGSRYNQAASSIQADSAELEGRMNQLQLQRA